MIFPRSKLIHDAIDLIPDSGFTKNHKQYRNALHNKIDAVEKIIEKDNINGAINKLENDVKRKLEDWLIDDYKKEDLLQYSKEEMIELVDRTIERLNQIKHKNMKKLFKKFIIKT